MKHRTKTIENQTHMRCAHLLSGVAMSQCHSHHVCVLQTLHVRKLRIKTVVHCMFLLKQTFCCLFFLSMSVTMHRQCMTSYNSVNHTTKHLSLVRYGHLRCLQWCIIEQICEIISHATCPVYGLVSSSTSSLSSCVKHVMTALSRPGGV